MKKLLSYLKESKQKPVNFILDGDLADVYDKNKALIGRVIDTPNAIEFLFLNSDEVESVKSWKGVITRKNKEKRDLPSEWKNKKLSDIFVKIRN